MATKKKKKIKPVPTALCIKDWKLNDLLVFAEGNSYPVVNRITKFGLVGLEILGKGRTVTFYTGSEYFEID